MGAVFEGIGVSSGSFIAGNLIEKYNGVKTFRYFGIGALVLFLVHIAVQKCLDMSQGKLNMTKSGTELTHSKTEKQKMNDCKHKVNGSENEIGDNPDDDFKEIDLKL